MTQPIATHDPGAKLSATRVRLGEFDYEIGPLGHLAAERERLAGLSWRAFDAVPLGATTSALLAHHRDKDPGAAWRRRVHDMWPIIWAAWLGAFAVAVVFGLFG